MGIAVTPPIAHGARRIGHFVSACFLITEEVPNARNLTTFARDVACRPAASVALAAAGDDRRPGPTGRQDARGRLLARAVVSGGISWCASATTDRRSSSCSTRSRFRAGAGWVPRPPGGGASSPTWTVSALPFTTRAERLRFLRRYLRCGRLTPENKSHARTIDALSQRWQRHETQRVKMNDLFEEWNRQLAREPATEQTAAAGVTR